MSWGLKTQWPAGDVSDFPCPTNNSMLLYFCACEQAEHDSTVRRHAVQMAGTFSHNLDPGNVPSRSEPLDCPRLDARHQRIEYQVVMGIAMFESHSGVSTWGPWFARVGCRAQSQLSGAIHTTQQGGGKYLVRTKGKLAGAMGKGWRWGLGRFGQLQPGPSVWAGSNAISH